MTSTSHDTGGPRVRNFWLLVHASIIATTGALPVFLVAAVATLARVDLGFREDQLGAGVAVYFGSAAVSAIWGGRFVQLVRSTVALRIGALGSSASLVWLSLVTSWGQVLLALFFAGVAHTICQVASNLRLADHVTLHRMGIAFGIKQSALPGATLLAGVGLPLVAVNLGWRAVFVLGALIAAGAAIFQPRVNEAPFVRPSLRLRRAARRHSTAQDVNRRALTILSLAVGFAAAAATAMGSFIVEYATSLGIEPAMAGSTLVIASALGITTRVTIGWWADKKAFDQLLMVSMMIGVGSLAVFSFAIADGWWLVTVAASVSYMLAWGWPGLFQFAVVTKNPHAPAIASGITLVGVFVGGTVGPFMFGWLVVTFGYGAAWTMDFVWLLVGAALMMWGRHEYEKPTTPHAGAQADPQG